MNVDSLLVRTPLGCPSFSWSTGYQWPCASTLDLIRKNPIAFFNYSYLHGQLELAEFVLTHYCDAAKLLLFLQEQGEMARIEWVNSLLAQE